MKRSSVWALLQVVGIHWFVREEQHYEDKWRKCDVCDKEQVSKVGNMASLPAGGAQ